MKIDKYPVIIGETSMVFEFTSKGIRGKVPKLVVYSETHVRNIYNLRFEDKDEVMGQTDDEIITNNGNSEKILTTVASALYVFIERYPGAMFFAMDGTKARTRLYRIGITNNLKEIQKILMYMDY